MTETRDPDAEDALARVPVILHVQPLVLLPARHAHAPGPGPRAGACLALAGGGRHGAGEPHPRAHRGLDGGGGHRGEHCGEQQQDSDDHNVTRPGYDYP